MKTKVFKVDNSLSEVAPSVVYDCELRPQKKIEIALPVVSGCELALQPKIETSKAHDYPVILPTPPRSSTTVVPTKSAMTCGQPFLEKRPIPSSGSSSGSFTSEDEYEYDTTIETLTTTTVVKETTTTIMFECRKQLSSNADDILYGVPTIDDLLGFIAAERLRSMPHKGSAWDKVLKWAEGFSKKVDVFCYTIGSFTLARREGEQMVYGCCRTLLKVSFLFFYSSSLLLTMDELRHSSASRIFNSSKRCSTSCTKCPSRSTFSSTSATSFPLLPISNSSLPPFLPISFPSPSASR